MSDRSINGVSRRLYLNRGYVSVNQSQEIKYAYQESLVLIKRTDLLGEFTIKVN